MDSEELRNLYANLLAKAMNSDTKDQVHPSFVEIIKQMSPIDSLVFNTIMERSANPIIDLVYERSEPKFPIPVASRTIATNISDIDIAPMKNISLSIDNLVKHGLISIPESLSYTEKELYDNILCSPFYLEQQQNHPTTPDGFIFSHVKKFITHTNLGISFYNICVIN